MDLPNPPIDDADHHPSFASTSSGEQETHRSPSGKDKKDIAIIGAGPSGLAALKIILDHPLFNQGLWRPVLFEARDGIGGIWLPSLSPPPPSLPLTPLYDALSTNLPHPVMAFPTHPFPPSTPLYPTASIVLSYLQSYVSHFSLDPYISLNTSVLSTSFDSSKKKWKVRVRNKADTGEYEESDHLFDLVVVANGHYKIPRYPRNKVFGGNETVGKGLDAWLKNGKATHSVWFRNAWDERYGLKHTGRKKILVVGAGPSGIDVAAEFNHVAKEHPNLSIEIVHSFSGATNEDIEEGKFKRRPRIQEFLSSSKGEVLFKDGTTEEGITHCILATGYESSFSFLEPPNSEAMVVEIPPPIPPLPSTGKLYNSTYHVFPLAKHIFPIVSSQHQTGNYSVFPPSSLVFLGLLYRVAPFPLVEAQMRAVVHVFEDPSRLDLLQESVEIISRYEEIRDTVLLKHPNLSSASPSTELEGRIAKLWHVMDGDEQFEYRDSLHKFVGFEGTHGITPEWVKEMYEKKYELKAAWKEIEKEGLGEEWVRGVGEERPGEKLSPEEQWVECMRKVLKWAEERKVIEGKKADDLELAEGAKL
ncbi:hypothetical protein C8Q75DRAFT_768410 [Abortiporus biennis]|nr:hypothetical protein C8Q75DRAFT_768410 [Abortiporus biennis]